MVEPDVIECINATECESAKAGETPDMRLGDTCVLCCCRECERCGATIDIDEEKQVSDGQGYINVCDACYKYPDALYGLERPLPVVVTGIAYMERVKALTATQPHIRQAKA
tara:strand:+ start:1403 stop:1735 length:333 start_codon:yes stop_codon:yes gene_type:complete